MGIAVGMASSMAPHNATDVYKALDLILEDALNGVETQIDALIGIVKAPDFPTGAQIVDLKGIHDAYRNGHGRAVMRSKYTVEEERGHQQIVVTEIPYKVNKAKLVIQIDDMRKNGIEDIREVRDESNKDGIRIVIELKKEANVQWIIKRLLKHTDLQCNFSMNHVALVNGKPVEKLTLKDLLEHFLAHAAEVVRRRTAFDLDKAQKRAHIVEGIMICLNGLDDTIAIVRAAKSRQEAVSGLMDRFDLSDKQANAVVDMRLYSISQAPIAEYAAESESLANSIEAFTAVLNDEAALLTAVRTELQTTAEMFKDGRLTEIAPDMDGSDDERDLIKEETLVITYTDRGLIKSVSETEYTATGRRAKGTKAGNMKEDETVHVMLTVSSKDDILFFTNSGRCHVLPAFKIPVSSRTAAGKYVNNYLNLESEEKIISILSASPNLADTDLLFVTKNGIGKRLELQNLSRRLSVTKVISFKEDDELVSCTLVKPAEEVIVITAGGQAIRFDLDNESKGIRPMGRTAAGVKAIKLREYDTVVDVLVLDGAETFLMMTENGYAKRCKVSDFPAQARGGQGVRAATVSEKTGAIVSAMTVLENDDLFIASKNGKLSRTSVAEIPVLGRQAAGVLTMGLADDDIIVSISKNTGEEESEAEDANV